MHLHYCTTSSTLSLVFENCMLRLSLSGLPFSTSRLVVPTLYTYVELYIRACAIHNLVALDCAPGDSFRQFKPSLYPDFAASNPTFLPARFTARSSSPRSLPSPFCPSRVRPAFPPTSFAVFHAPSCTSPSIPPHSHHSTSPSSPSRFDLLTAQLEDHGRGGCSPCNHGCGREHSFDKGREVRTSLWAR
jgi:hypothetical protein